MMTTAVSIVGDTTSSTAVLQGVRQASVRKGGVCGAELVTGEASYPGGRDADEDGEGSTGLAGEQMRRTSLAVELATNTVDEGVCLGGEAAREIFTV